MRLRLLLLIFLPFSVVCQNTIGLPDVINYSKLTYGAGLQNWDIKQDKNGIIYLANNEGLLTFDGRNWNLYPLPNKTIVRSVEIGPDGKIYVGGQDEMGYFIPEKNGTLKYHSLTQLVPVGDKSFGDVWDIVFFEGSIYFRTFYKIYRVTNKSIIGFPAAGEWAFLEKCNGRLYAHDFKTGIMVYANGRWEQLYPQNPLPLQDPVTGILPVSDNEIVITTLKNGLFLMTVSGLVKLESSNNILFETERIYAATKVSSDWIALATNNNGVYIIDSKANIIQRFSKTEGLQNKNVLSIFLDNQSNLWLGLDNGIDIISYNSSIKKINPFFQDGAGYTILLHDNKLYAGTSNGLYSVPLKQNDDLSFCKGLFLPVNNTKGQVWGLAKINNQLLLGHHEGAFVVADNTAEKISTDLGFWNFIPASSSLSAQKIISGSYKGLAFFDFINGRFNKTGVLPDFNESSRYIAIDNDNIIWVSHPYHGVYKISQTQTGSYRISSYTEKNGLPSTLNNHIFKVRNEVVVATEKGVYKYDAKKEGFIPADFFTPLLGTKSIRYIKEDAEGNIWFIHEKTPGVVDMSGKEPIVIFFPELTNKLLSGFEFIYPLNKNNIFLGAEKGFFHINYEKYKATQPNLAVQIRTVRIGSKSDSLLFGGYFGGLNEKQVQQFSTVPDITYNKKNIRFDYSAPIFGYQSNLEYSYRLKGFDDNWSDWSKRTEKEYTNLPSGHYTFQVKVRNNFEKESDIADFTFNILPPWYLKLWAKILYGLFFLGLIFLLYQWQEKRLSVQQLRYEEEQKKLLYIHELELSKTESELVSVKNEKLEAEINFKNSELASSAMHLVKKGELLTKMKAELSQIVKGVDNPTVVADIKKMMRSLSEDDNMDKEWENFTKHFDKVHSDFVIELKKAHPTITPNEVKLCAYLRMNLTTKEISQLMNISIRGVEISRYRLRKKLGISSETNLFSYLINLQPRKI